MTSASLDDVRARPCDAPPPADSEAVASDAAASDDGATPRTTPRTTSRWIRWAALAAIVVIALVIRYRFLDFETMDYRAFLSRWYETLDAGGFSALKERFADYNYPYLYLLWGLTALHIPSLVGVKALSIIFDLVLAFFAYRIVALKTDRFWLRALAFGVILLLPSVIANSAYWGQADAIYSSWVLGGIYFLMRATADGIDDSSRRRNSVWACALFGIAIAFKLQAIFVMPVLAWLLLRRAFPWYSLLVIPAVYALLDVPALLVGAPWREVFSVYLDQTDSYKQLTLGAANLYQLIPISGDATWLAHTGIAVAAGIIVAFLAWSVWKKPPVTPTTLLAVATASAVIVPFLLPAMHDRYFYTAEILTVVLAFYLPLRFVIIPILVQLAAIGVYHSSLTGDQGQGMGGQGGFGGGGQGGGGQGGFGGGDQDGGGQGGGTPPGGDRGASGGYSSGRGDTALSIYAAMMGLAALGLVYSVGDSIKRARSALTSR